MTLKFASPKAALADPRGVFNWHIRHRIAPEGNGMPLLDHPAVEILVFGTANSNHAPVSVRVAA